MTSFCHLHRSVTSAVFLVILSFGFCGAACDTTTATDYVQISEPYDRNYSSITSADTHPLGFYRGTWNYNQQGMANPCFKVTGATGRRLEIKVETVPRMKLCVKDQASPTTCFEGRFTNCRDTPGGIVFIEFLCDSQCGETDVTFWYRLTLSKIDEDPEQFCFNVGSTYPEDLSVMPPGATFPTVTTPRSGPSGRSSSVQPWALLTLMLAVMSQTALHLSVHT